MDWLAILTNDLAPLWLSVKLAATTVLALMIVSLPVAWWLAFGNSRARPAVRAIVALPLVLPPSVLGFYLLLTMAPSGWLGGTWVAITGDTLAFSFAGLVLASMVYSLPFVVQPLEMAFHSMGRAPLEAAATLGASPRQTITAVALPYCRRGILTASVLGFAHTLGEFGVVLMVGGNIPGRTRVVSVAIYDHVESLAYDQAHVLSGLLLVLSFIVLLAVYAGNWRWMFPGQVR